ncbi:MAG TPA: large-conductance mechanosensitive channel protein MscL [Cryomorphaceae bacterium]|nr:large-conductance mechanosensitive channel protein MscL [Cryomorphaceae bacterium]
MFAEFKKFINRGNVMELAVGLILATYFGLIIKSLVADIIMPPIGLLLGGVDFADLKYVLTAGVAESAEGAGDAVAEVAISYGAFINTVITFIIVAMAVFMVVRTYNKMKEATAKKEEQNIPAPEIPEPTKEELLLREIRDLLQK